MARFIRPGKSKVYFLPAIANKAAPTTPEIAAGTDLSGSISDPGSTAFNNEPVQTPDLASTFTSQIPGRDTAEAPTITFYDDDASTAIRTLLSKGVTGYLLKMPYGNVTTKRAETYPVTVTGVNDTWSAGNDAATFIVGFAVTGVPVLNAVLP